MKECPYCKGEVPEGAIKCKHCGSNIPVIKNMTSGQAVFFTFFSIIFICIIAAFCYAISGGCDSSGRGDSSGHRITKDQLNQITVGMSLSEVERIMGGEGKILVENNIENSEFKNFKRISWTNSDGTGIAVTFHDDKVHDRNWWPTK